jgi:DNA-binding FadR family transcriptional regulator
VHSQREVVEAIVRGDTTGARRAAEQHLRGFSISVRSVLRARNEDGRGRSIVG